MDKTSSKCVGSAAHILAFLFTSASWQCCNVCASQFSFVNMIKYTVPPSEACLYGDIQRNLQRFSNLYLAWHSLWALLEVEVVKTKLASGLMFRSNLFLVMPLWVRSEILAINFKNHEDSRNSSGHGSGISAESEKKEDQGAAFLMSYFLHQRVLLCQHHLHQLCRLVLFHNFWINGKAKLSIFVFNIVNGYYL